MDIEVLTLCDYAQTIGDKLNVLGVFNKLHFDKFPSSYAFCIVGRFRFKPEESSGEKKFVFKLVDEENNNVFTPLMAVAELPAGKTEFVSVNLIINIQNVSFGKEAEYNLIVETPGGNYEVPLSVKLNES